MRAKPTSSTLLKALLFHVELAAFVLGGVLALGGEWTWAAVSIGLAVTADVLGRLWSRGSPVPMPYFMRWVLHLPRGPQSPQGLARALDLMRRAAGRGLTNIVPRQGDAQRLPYLDHGFDAAYLISVLGEIPDPVAALRELRRVLKPEGRLVVGEVVIDPDFVSLPALEENAEKAGFALARSAGPRCAYLAVLRPTAA